MSNGGYELTMFLGKASRDALNDFQNLSAEDFAKRYDPG
jgi:hypothetical protein